MLKAIATRRSIRSYLEKDIEDARIHELLKAAMAAPSAMNRQSTKYIVITNKQTLKDVPNLSSHAAMVAQAPLAIVVLGDYNCEERSEYLYVNAAAAIENMLLEGVEQGLGSCWCAIAPNEDRAAAFKDYFKLPDHLLPIAIVAFGYGNEAKEGHDRYLEDQVQWVK